MFSYGKPYVETKGDGTADVVTIPDDKLKVTGQEDYSSVLTSSSTEYTGINALPEIPEANSAYDKGTEQNPLVVLEVDVYKRQHVHRVNCRGFSLIVRLK